MWRSIDCSIGTRCTFVTTHCNRQKAAGRKASAKPTATANRQPRAACYFAYMAVTVVLMPPRGVNSPATVIRLGAQAATRSSRIWFVALS